MGAKAEIAAAMRAMASTQALVASATAALSRAIEALDQPPAPVAPLQPVTNNYIGDGAYLTARQLAERLKVSETVLYRQRRDGTGPPFVMVGKSIRYPVRDLAAFERRVHSTAEVNAAAMKREARRSVTIIKETT
jgi:hypothetical protein